MQSSEKNGILFCALMAFIDVCRSKAAYKYLPTSHQRQSKHARCVRGVCAVCARCVRGAVCVRCVRARCVRGVCAACARRVRGVCAACANHKTRGPLVAINVKVLDAVGLPILGLAWVALPIIWLGALGRGRLLDDPARLFFKVVVDRQILAHKERA